MRLDPVPVFSGTSGGRMAGCAVALLATCAMSMVAAAAKADDSEETERKVLKVCADPNNLPFSNQQGEGYENKLAELFGREMGLPVQTYFYAQRLNFVRNTLRFKLPGEDFRCDIMMGVPVGFNQVATSRPYYRSTYALAFIKGRGLDMVNSVAFSPAFLFNQIRTFSCLFFRRTKIGLITKSF